MPVRRRVRKDPNWEILVGGGSPYPITTTPPPAGDNELDNARRAIPDALWGTVQTDPQTGLKAFRFPTKHVDCGLLPSVGYAGRNTLATVGTTTAVTTYSAINTTPVIIEGKKFLGRVNITGSGYIFRNCWFAWNGAGVTSYGPIVNAIGYNVEDILFEDCLFEPDTPSIMAAIDIQGHGFTARRCVFRNTEDGIDPACSSRLNADGTRTYKTDWNIRVIGSWAGDLALWSPNQFRSPSDNESHCDVIQPNGGHNVWFQGCVLSGWYNTAIANANEPSRDGVDSAGNAIHIGGNKNYPNMQSTSVMMGTPIDANMPLGDWHYERCYISGGAYGFNLPVTTFDGDLFIADCVFDKGSTRVGGGTSYVVAKTAILGRVKLSGNILDDFDLNASPVKAGTPMTTVKTQ